MANPLFQVQTIVIEDTANERSIGNDGSDDRQTVGTITSTALTFGNMAPGETSSTRILYLKVPNSIGIDNIQLALIYTGGITFANDVFGIEPHSHIDRNIAPNEFFQGVNSDEEATSAFNIAVDNATINSSIYAYVNLSLPSDHILQTGTIRYKWFFDFADEEVIEKETEIDNVDDLLDDMRDRIDDHYNTDRTSPSVTITSPTSADTYETNEDTIEIGGTASDNIEITSVIWANSKGGAGVCTGTTAWNKDGITLLEGDNVITITATDSSGNTATDTLRVTYTIVEEPPPDGPIVTPPSTDLIAPTVTITSPTSNTTYETDSPAISIGGTASDNVGVEVVVWSNNRGGSGDCEGTVLWSKNGIELFEGENIITIRALDSKQNVGVDTLTVNYTVPDTIIPIVTIVNPTTEPSFTTVSNTLDVSGFATDNVAVTAVTWQNDQGGAGACVGEETWSKDDIPLQIGQNLITITAHDANDNRGSSTLSVTANEAGTDHFYDLFVMSSEQYNNEWNGNDTLETAGSVWRLTFRREDQSFLDTYWDQVRSGSIDIDYWMGEGKDHFSYRPIDEISEANLDRSEVSFHLERITYDLGLKETRYDPHYVSVLYQECFRVVYPVSPHTPIFGGNASLELRRGINGWGVTVSTRVPEIITLAAPEQHGEFLLLPSEYYPYGRGLLTNIYGLEGNSFNGTYTLDDTNAIIAPIVPLSPEIYAYSRLAYKWTGPTLNTRWAHLLGDFLPSSLVIQEIKPGGFYPTWYPNSPYSRTEINRYKLVPP